MTISQPTLPLQFNIKSDVPGNLAELFARDLDFHDSNDYHALHRFHSFPAKFPPQLPRKFIRALTKPGDVVLDPMMGSGTTILEAYLLERQALGFDIDPMALRLAQIKVIPFDVKQIAEAGELILKQAQHNLQQNYTQLQQTLTTYWDLKTQQFVNHWFAVETQLELLALIDEIQKIKCSKLRTYFELIFSSVIITKSGGISLALDLAHTRPHKAKIVFSQTGEVLVGEHLLDDPSPRLKILTKTLRSPIQEFEKRLQKNLKNVLDIDSNRLKPNLRFADVQNLPLENEAVDLIVTSPPYAANAIDYMRAHKFSLVWLGYTIEELGKLRGTYVGGESVSGIDFEDLPPITKGVMAEVAELDAKKGRALHRYYSEMKRIFSEMYRVLKPGKVAVVVVGSSLMRGRDTETGRCLAEIGRDIGFDETIVGIRQLDRNRRMLPAGKKINLQSQIQKRMHEEYVIGFVKF